MWLFDNKAEYLHPAFMERLADIDAHTNYQVLSNRGGSKSPEIKMCECRIKILHNEAKRALGTLGMPPPCPTIRFEALEADVDWIYASLVSIRKEKMENGIMMKPGAYTAFGSYFRYLFHRYGHVPSQAFKNEMEDAVKGMSRYERYIAREDSFDAMCRY